jgi:hypothetical protein
MLMKTHGMLSCAGKLFADTSYREGTGVEDPLLWPFPFETELLEASALYLMSVLIGNFVLLEVEPSRTRLS